MMKIERIKRTPKNDPFYVRSELDVAWLSIYAMMEDNAFDYHTKWAQVPAPFANAGDYVEIPF